MNTTTENGNNVVGDTIRREEQLSWLGGITCGEGCISGYFDKNHIGSDNIKRTRLQLEARIVNTDKILIEKIETILRVNGINPIIYWSRSKCDRYKPLGVVKIVGNNKLRKFLTLLLPYLFGTKSEVAKKMIRLIDYRLEIPHGNQYTGRQMSDDLLHKMLEDIRLLNSSPQRLHAILPKKEDDIVSSI